LAQEGAPVGFGGRRHGILQMIACGSRFLSRRCGPRREAFAGRRQMWAAPSGLSAARWTCLRRVTTTAMHRSI
jgi:hypothetical protein